MEEEHPESSIYICDTLFEREICGVLFKWKEMSGTEMLSTMSGADANEENRVKYLKKLVKVAVVEPKDLDVDRLKTAVLIQLVGAIEETHGLNEVVQKNLTTRSLANPPSTQLPMNLENE